MIGIQAKMLEDIETEIKQSPRMEKVPFKDLRKITGKLSWIAGRCHESSGW